MKIEGSEEPPFLIACFLDHPLWMGNLLGKRQRAAPTDTVGPGVYCARERKLRSAHAGPWHISTAAQAHLTAKVVIACPRN